MEIIIILVICSLPFIFWWLSVPFEKVVADTFEMTMEDASVLCDELEKIKNADTA
jgi:hypothetical protein